MTFGTALPHYPAAMPQLDSVGSTLLKSASDLLAAEGPGALTVRRIANEAGVSTMNVYSRFGGKDGVVEHLFVEGFRLLGEGMRSIVDSGDPVADMVSCGMAYRQFAIEQPDVVLGDVRSRRSRLRAEYRSSGARRIDTRIARRAHRTSDVSGRVANGGSVADRGAGVGDVPRCGQPRIEGGRVRSASIGPTSTTGRSRR